MIFTNWRY